MYSHKNPSRRAPEEAPPISVVTIPTTSAPTMSGSALMTHPNTSSKDIFFTDSIPNGPPPPLSAPVYTTSKGAPKTVKHSVGAKLEGTPININAASPTTTTKSTTMLIQSTKDTNDTIPIIPDIITYDLVPPTHILEELLKSLQADKLNHKTKKSTPDLSFVYLVSSPKYLHVGTTSTPRVILYNLLY